MAAREARHRRLELAVRERDEAESRLGRIERRRLLRRCSVKSRFAPRRSPACSRCQASVVPIAHVRRDRQRGGNLGRRKRGILRRDVRGRRRGLRRARGGRGAAGRPAATHQREAALARRAPQARRRVMPAPPRGGTGPSTGAAHPPRSRSRVVGAHVADDAARADTDRRAAGDRRRGARRAPAPSRSASMPRAATMRSTSAARPSGDFAEMNTALRMRRLTLRQLGAVEQIDLVEDLEDRHALRRRRRRAPRARRPSADRDPAAEASITCSSRSAAVTSSSVARNAATSWCGSRSMKPTVSESSTCRASAASRGARADRA